MHTDLLEAPPAPRFAREAALDQPRDDLAAALDTPVAG